MRKVPHASRGVPSAGVRGEVAGEAGEPRVAVMIPCLNEELTVGRVVADFRAELPSAEIVVFDNGSTDETATAASAAGATVITEPRLGKGFVVDSMLDRISADIYVMVDGDDTYPAQAVHQLLRPLLAGDADMTVGARLAGPSSLAFRRFHRFGNSLVRGLVNWLGQAQLTDIMSGYRAITRRAVARLPVVSSGIEIETEMTMQMLYYRLKIIEVPVDYRERPEGSMSKLRTFRDGVRVIWKIFHLFRTFKPLTFFGSLGLLALACGLGAGIPPIHDYLTDPNHFVRHIPLAVLATGLVLMGTLLGFLGLLLHAINWRFIELHNVLTRWR